MDDCTIPSEIGIIAIEATTACVELQWYIHYTCGGNGVVIFLLYIYIYIYVYVYVYIYIYEYACKIWEI